MKRFLSAAFALSLCASWALGDELRVKGILYEGVKVTGVEKGLLTFRIGNRSIAKPLENITRIRLPGHDVFNDAERLFYEGKYEAAVSRYQAVGENSPQLVQSLALARIVQAKARAEGKPGDAPKAVAPKVRKCRHCADTGLMRCPDCNATGFAKCAECKGIGRITCPACKGTSQRITCSRCGGDGKTRTSYTAYRTEKTRRADGTSSTKRIPYTKTKRVKCSSCGGRGRWWSCGRCMNEGRNRGTIRCLQCGGSRKWGKCPTCNGTKRVPCTHCGKAPKAPGAKAPKGAVENKRPQQQANPQVDLTKANPLDSPDALAYTLGSRPVHPRENPKIWADMTSLQKQLADGDHKVGLAEWEKKNDFHNKQVQWNLRVEDVSMNSHDETFIIRATSQNGHVVSATLGAEARSIVVDLRKGSRVRLCGAIGSYSFRKESPGRFDPKSRQLRIELADAKVLKSGTVSAPNP